ncbi:MAG TPA: S41 family peptidase [Gaiellaceae bacterium]|nr:S41 family peptidase [Gaiellaceae bacterium]
MRRRAGPLVAAILVVGAFFLGFLITQADSGAPSAVAPLRADRPVGVVDEVRAELTSAYYRWIEPDVLRLETVDEIVAGLEDPHTDYLTPAEYESIRETTEGTYSGIGLTVGPARRGLLVTSALRGPARAAGIRKGDVIVGIDGERAGALPFDRSLALIKGETGTLVHLTVRRPQKGRIDFTVMRQDIDVPPISARMLKMGKTKIAYVRVFGFPDGAAERIERATTRLVEQGARGAVVDLRDNPGGLFSQAVSSASIYLEDGIVCRTDGVHEEAQTFTVTGEATHPELPLVVLVNGGSASAAEILAGALYDYDRATLVGERTYGKASVQTIAPLRNGGALKLTTAKYVTPAGADITGRGIHPGIVAVDDPLTEPDEALLIARRTLADVLAAG